MSGSILFTLEELAEQLNIGVSTLKVWRKRYDECLTTSPKNKGYTLNQSKRFKIIADCSAAGMAVDSIKEILSVKVNEAPSDRDYPRPPEKSCDNNLLKPEKADGFSEILTEILSQQKKIAAAQERRALAEEKKAYALESRAEAEHAKAEIMKEMLLSVQDSPIRAIVRSLMEKIKDMPGSDLSEDLFPPEFDSEEPNDYSDLPELTESLDPPSPTNFEELAETELFEKNAEKQSLQQTEPDMDDLSLLLDESASQPIEDIDDLSLLLDDSSPLPPEEPDAPEALPDKSETQKADDIDDLSLLIGPTISLEDEAVDDLSKLINAEEIQAESPQPPPSADDYKSKILKRIIMMKGKEGLSIEETRDQFNREGLKTLSGKGQWDTKTIAGIYKYIDSVQNKLKGG